MWEINVLGKVIKHLEDGVLENAKDIFSKERNLPPH